jgi:hypothetical protein
MGDDLQLNTSNGASQTTGLGAYQWSPQEGDPNAVLVVSTTDQIAPPL